MSDITYNCQYTVISMGETIESIASMYNVRPIEIMRANSELISLYTSRTTLPQGTILTVPCSRVGTATDPPIITPCNYVYQQNDSLESAANALDTSMENLLYYTDNDLPQVGSVVTAVGCYNSINGMYVTNLGDTLQNIANRFNIPVDTLVSYNAIRGSVVSTLPYGLTLIIPWASQQDMTQQVTQLEQAGTVTQPGQVQQFTMTDQQFTIPTQPGQFTQPTQPGQFTIPTQPGQFQMDGQFVETAQFGQFQQIPQGVQPGATQNLTNQTFGLPGQTAGTVSQPFVTQTQPFVTQTQPFGANQQVNAGQTLAQQRMSQSQPNIIQSDMQFGGFPNGQPQITGQGLINQMNAQHSTAAMRQRQSNVWMG